jgi:hypothetical protein
MAALTSGITLVLLLIYRLLNKKLSVIDSLGLALAGGLGFVVWFGIFNVFSLSGLNQDLPIPLFPISPEDMGCGITVLLLTFLYYLSGISFSKNNIVKNSWRRFGIIALLLPALVALMIDIYFI